MPNRDTRRSRAYRLAEKHILGRHPGAHSLADFIRDLRDEGASLAAITRHFDTMPGGGPSIETIRRWTIEDQENEK
jgi:hypothetical protein